MKKILAIIIIVTLVIEMNHHVSAATMFTAYTDGYLEGSHVWGTLNTNSGDRAFGSTNGMLGGSTYVIQITYLYYNDSSYSYIPAYGSNAGTSSVTAVAVGTGTGVHTYKATSYHLVISPNDFWERELVL